MKLEELEEEVDKWCEELLSLSLGCDLQPHVPGLVRYAGGERRGYGLPGEAKAPVLENTEERGGAAQEGAGDDGKGD